MEGKNVDLNINPETVCVIIDHAREFQAKEAVTFPENTIPGSENEYDPLQILADHKDDLSFQECQSIIDDLEPDQQVDLVAIMYLGRGDFEVNNFGAARREAKRNLAPRLTEYLFSKPEIAHYLERGLELLGRSCD